MTSNNISLAEDQGGSSAKMTKDDIRQQIENLSIHYHVPIITCMTDLDKIVLGVNLDTEHCGVGYGRYSSIHQKDGFSLDAQIRKILELAQNEGIKIIAIFADAAQSAYHKKDRPGIKACLAAVIKKSFKILYIHKVDRIARRLEWFLEILTELEFNDVTLRVVDQQFNLTTPEGKLIARLLSTLAEFYSDNLGRETNKGRHESSLQGFS